MSARNLVDELAFAGVGSDVWIWPRAHIVNPETITLGDSVIIDDFAFVMGGQRTVIGSFVHIAAFTLVVGGGELHVADFAGISGGVQIYTGNDDYLGGCLTGPTVPFPYRKPTRSFVRLEKHVVIGAKSVILPGVVIGEGSVIGANSTVTRSCEPWGVYAGSPVRRIKERPSETILELEAQLRRELYDSKGLYIPKAARTVEC